MGNITQACKFVHHQRQMEPGAISKRYTIPQFVDPAIQISHLDYEKPQYLALADYLYKTRQQYFDDYAPYQSLMGPEVNWQRLSKVYPDAKIQKNEQFDFEYEDESLKGSYINSSFIQCINKLKKHPQIVKKMFANLEINPTGFYVLHFCINGKIQKQSVPIIIDDYIPVNSSHQYLLGRPKNNMVWMILVEKAWAKIMKSYLNIFHLKMDEIFEETTGIPSFQLFKPGYYLSSNSIQFEPLQSKYVKFTIFSDNALIFSIWQTSNFLNSDNEVNNSFIMQLIRISNEAPQNSNKMEHYTLQEAVYKAKNNNKLILSRDGQFLVLKPGKYILHLFNLVNYKTQNNLVIYARERVEIHLRKQQKFRHIKHLMIKNLYKGIHNSLQMTHETSEVSLRFVWRNHRGILCLKNKNQTKVKKIIVKILPKYKTNVIFQDETPNTQQRQKQVKSQQHCFFIFIRVTNGELGKFYETEISDILAQ